MRAKRNICAGVVAALLGSVAATTAVAVDPAALIDASDVDLRDDLTWLADRGRIDVSLTTWPLPMTMLSAAMGSAGGADWSPADLDALRRIRAALRRFDAAATLGWKLNTARHPVSDAGLAVRARHEASGQLQLGGPAGALRLRVAVQQQPIARTPSSATLDGSFASTQLGDVVLALAQVDRWWGPARFASTILGNAAPPTPALLLRRARDDAPGVWPLAWIGPWSYELSVGRPSHYHPSGPSTLGLRLTMRPWPGVELGASRYIYWGGKGRPRSLGSLRDALLGSSNIDDPALQGADPSNEIAGLDLRWAWAGPAASWVGYAHLAGEDEAGTSPSKLIATLGLQLKHATEAQRLEWTVEGSDTRLGRLFGLRSGARPSAYQHSVYVDGHYHQGLPVGAFIGGGGAVLGVGLVLLPLEQAWRYEARLWSARVSGQAPEAINAAYGVPGKVFGASLQAAGAAGGLRWRLGLDLQRYPAAARRVLGLVGGVELPMPER